MFFYRIFLTILSFLEKFDKHGSVWIQLISKKDELIIKINKNKKIDFSITKIDFNHFNFIHQKFDKFDKIILN